MGADPETKTINGAEQTEQETGQCKEFTKTNFTLILYKNRIDYVLSYRPIDDETLLSPSIGDYESAIYFLKGIALRNAASKRKVVRLAVAGSIISAAADNDEALRKLATSMDGVSLAEGFEDLQVRVNFPRKSEVIQAIRINRLTTWSAIRFGALLLGQPDAHRPSNLSKPHAQCVLDVNIALQPKPVPAAKVPALVDELIATARTVMRAG